ncbi:hypothetical protein BH23ACT9_BH23ACT9_21070 [soil metagenome]
MGRATARRNDYNAVMSDTKPVQRTLRLRQETADRLDAAAARSAESTNAVADRLLLEALRLQDHPLVQFRTGASGHREPHLVGTRLKVRDIIATARGHQGDIQVTAAYFDLPVPIVDAAIAYYAEFTDEIDTANADAARYADEQRQRWERQQALLS